MTGRHAGTADGACICDEPGCCALLECGCWTWTHGEPRIGGFIGCGTLAHQSSYKVLEVRPGRPAAVTIVIGCEFCHQERRKDPVTAEGMRAAAGAYIAHLIESHWDKLQAGRLIAVAAGSQDSDNWTRI